MHSESDASVQPTAIGAEQPSELDAAFGDELAFRAWYEQSLPRVYAYLFHRCGRDSALAEELTQQAFVEVVRTHRHFRGRSDALTWVISIARNKLVDYFRRADRDRNRLAALGAWHLGRQPEVGWPESARDDVDEALDTLPSYQRAVLVLHYMDHLSVREVARQIGRSETATASLLARARDAFRHAYQQVDP